MTVIASVMSLTVSLLLILIVPNVCNRIQFRMKVKQFKQLKQICLYLALQEQNKFISQEKIKEKNIQVEGEWLYSDNFYFNLNDGKAFERARKYYWDYFSYFLKSGKFVENEDLIEDSADLANILKRINTNRQESTWNFQELLPT